MELVYRFTEDFPDTEKFGLVTQMRRAAVSIPSNIAEGRRRGSRQDYRRFIVMAYGSGGELETQLVISRRLGFGNEKLSSEIDALMDQIMRMLNGLLRALAPSPRT